MKVKVLYFAGLREAVGCAGEDVEVPADVVSVGALRDRLAARGGSWPALLATRNLRVAVNQDMARLESPIAEGDEIAFFPPVTGG
jgi:molybdopterin synthase sulfur carrier subunit